jgi:hypothetical protein
VGPLAGSFRGSDAGGTGSASLSGDIVVPTSGLDAGQGVVSPGSGGSPAAEVLDDFRSPPKVLRLVAWVESIIVQQGGRVIGANLGSALASSNGSLYKAIKGTFLSLQCSTASRRCD